MSSVDTGIQRAAGTALFISSTPYNIALDAQPRAAVLAAFEAITDWKEINEVTNIGELGGRAELITHTPINTGVTKKIKGAINRGQADLMMAQRPEDPGQKVLIEAAEGTQSYVFKLVKPDGQVAGVQTPSIVYFNAKVMSYTDKTNQANEIIGATSTIEIEDKYFRVTAQSA